MKPHLIHDIYALPDSALPAEPTTPMTGRVVLINEADTRWAAQVMKLSGTLTSRRDGDNPYCDAVIVDGKQCFDGVRAPFGMAFKVLGAAGEVLEYGDADYYACWYHLEHTEVYVAVHLHNPETGRLDSIVNIRRIDGDTWACHKEVY